MMASMPSRLAPTYVTPLPPGWDWGRTHMALSPDNRIVITHPDYLPCVFDEKTRQWVELQP